MLIYIALAIATLTDWTGQYESGCGNAPAYVVVIGRGDNGWIAQWYSQGGVLCWFGEVEQKRLGEWVETYRDPPNSCPPYEWDVQLGLVPVGLSRNGVRWFLRRIDP